MLVVMQSHATYSLLPNAWLPISADAAQSAKPGTNGNGMIRHFYLASSLRLCTRSLPSNQTTQPPLPPHNDGAARRVSALDSGAPIEEIQTMKESLGGTLGYFLFRFGASLAAAMGILGLFLTIVGVYGIVSYAAAQRTQELGVRIALGASPRQVLAILLKQGAKLVAAGLLFGLAGAWGLTRAMSHMFVGVSPSDPLTYISVAALVSFITLFACWVPAQRALLVDPMIALRHE